MLQQVEFLQPLVGQRELVRAPRRDTGVDVAAVGGAHLRGHGRVLGGVAAGLALHGLAGHEPVVAAGLGRDIGGGVHVHIDVLATAAVVAVEEGNQRGHDGEVATGVVALVAAAAHGREGVVVVAVVPAGAPAGEDGEVVGRLIRAGRVAAEGRDRDVDEPLVRRLQVGEV